MPQKAIGVRASSKEETTESKGATKLERVTRSWKEHLAIAVMESSSFSKNLDWHVKGEKIYYKQKNNTTLELEKNDY